MPKDLKIVRKSRDNILQKSFREVSEYLWEVSESFREFCDFREVREYFQEVSEYSRLETSLQNVEPSFEKFGVIMANGGVE